MSQPKSTIKVWLQLFRAPNLFTVPGDPLAGFIYGAAIDSSRWTNNPFNAQVFLLMAASVCFYAGGLVLNDVMDLNEDRRDRPKRPLPAGEISVWSAWAAAISLMVGGLVLSHIVGFSSFVSGLLLVLAVVSYNCITKKIHLIGPINMGVCRGLSFLLGYTLGDRTPQWSLYGFTMALIIFMPALILTFYVAVVTQLSRRETEQPRPTQFGIVFPITILFIFPLVALDRLAELLSDRIVENDDLTPLFCWLDYTLFFVCLIAAFLQTAAVAAKLRKESPPPLPPQIGVLIRVLILIQATFCAGFTNNRAGVIAALVLVALWPISRAVGKKFYAS